MSPAAAVIGSLRIAVAVVVVKDQVFAFEPDDVGNALKVRTMLRDDESARVERDYHAGSINITALIVHGSCILSGPDSDVRRISSGAVAAAVCPGYIYCIVGIIELSAVTVPPRDGKKITKPAVYRREHRGRRTAYGKNVRPAGRSACDPELVAGYTLRFGQHLPVLCRGMAECTSREYQDQEINIF